MARREGLTEEDKRKLKEQIVKIGLTTVRQAKQKAPVDTGRLRASITIADNTGIIQPPGGEAREGDGVDSPDGEFTVRVGTKVEYAKFIEFGTVNRAPNPFLRPAKDAAFQKFDIEQT